VELDCIDSSDSLSVELLSNELFNDAKVLFSTFGICGANEVARDR
jgi:hypothetical protein